MTSQPHPHEVDVTLFVPCYNEEQNILDTLNTIEQACQRLALTYEVIVIDDASRDRSVERLRQYQTNHPQLPLRLVINPVNRGLAANFFTAAQIGHGRFIRIVCGDNVEPIATQVAILERRKHADIVIPYPVHVQNKSCFRLLVSRTYTRIINLLSGVRLRYWNGCALMRREDVVHSFPSTRGFGFQAALLSQLLSLGRTYTEIGCHYVERSAGISKALTLKNFRSVTHVALSLLGRRLASLGRLCGRLLGGFPSLNQSFPAGVGMYSDCFRPNHPQPTFLDSGRITSSV